MTLTPYLQDADLTLYNGDALEVLRELPSESVHCCVTSPPFYGLRDYGTGRWEGGDAECNHTRHVDYGEKSDTNRGSIRGGPFKNVCGKCGATRIDQQIGLEPTPEEWVARLVEVFWEVRRVLRKDGTLWLECGDSYNSGTAAKRNPTSTASHGRWENGDLQERVDVPGLKPKDLLGAPWMLAFALRADGWYLRSDIVWSRPNPMPESVTDRPTKSHSYVFELAKSGTPQFWTNEMRSIPGVRSKPAPDYWWFDPEGQAPPSETPVEGWTKRNAWRGHDYFFDQEAVRERYEGVADPRDFTPGNFRRGSYIHDEHHPARGPDGRRKTTVKGQDGSLQHRDGERWPNSGRNIRSVWEIATQPYPEAHFATYPEELVRRCILAGTSEKGCCSECGAPWVREVERDGEQPQAYEDRKYDRSDPRFATKRNMGARYQAQLDASPLRTTGWHPTCDHDIDPVPCVVLDPFAGAGTTGLVARKHARRSVLIELSEAYCRMSAERLSQLSLLSEVSA